MGKVSNVIEMRLPLSEAEVAYLTGRTLLTLANGRVLFDVHGTPVLADEFYEVTGRGIKRVA